MYNVNFKFNPKKLPSGDILKLEISFEVDEEGSTIDYVSEDVGLFQTKELDCEWDYDLDKRLLIPGACNMKLSCVDSDFTEYLFGTTGHYAKSNRRAKVDLYYYATGTPSYGIGYWITRFSGYIAEQTIRNIPDTSSITFTALPRTDILNRTKLSQTEIPNSWISFRELLWRCFKLVIPDLLESDIQINHPWLFKAQTHDFIEYEFPFYEDIPFEDLRINIWDYYYSAGDGYLGDYLRQLCYDFNCMIGISHNTVFLKALNFALNPSVVVIDYDERKRYENSFRHTFMDYLGVNHSDVPGGTVVYGVGSATGLHFLEGEEIEGANGETRELSFWFYIGVVLHSSELYTVYQSNVRAFVNGQIAHILSCKDNIISNSYIDFGSLLVKSWWEVENKRDNARVDNFTFNQIGLEFERGIRVNNKNYVLLKLREYPFQNLSEIEGKYVKDSL